MITSMGNAKLKNLTLLVNMETARREQGQFVIEGRKMFEETPKEWLLQIYVSETFEMENKALLSGKTYETLSDSVFGAVSDTQAPQGILALVKIPEYPLERLLLKTPAHLLILESIQDPGNLGTMLRTGEGAGIDGIILNRTTVDLFNPKTIRSTMGSIFRVPFFVSDDLLKTMRFLKERGVTLYAAHLDGAVSYEQPDYTKPAAFLIGNEGNGLSNETAKMADLSVKIPMAGQVESLNAAISAALFMYEAARQRRRV